MPRRPRRNHSPVFTRPRWALEAIKGEEPLITIAERFDVHPNQITKWKRQLLEGAAAVFGESEKDKEGGPCIAELHAKIGDTGSTLLVLLALPEDGGGTVQEPVSYTHLTLPTIYSV